MKIFRVPVYFLAAALLTGVPRGRAAEVPDVRRDAVVEAVDRVLPSVVNIQTKTRVERRGYFYDWWRDTLSPFTQELPPRESAGSGVIIDEAGYIITNVHVVENADEVWVKFWNDQPMMRAEVVVGMAESDVALLRLVAKPGTKFRAARLAPENDLILGETVLALGNPFGLGGSVSRGILSAKNRRALAESGRLDIPDWLQTDAAINPGNSGGPLVNLRGEVIGINVAVSKEGHGIGFAVPVRRVLEAMSEFFTPEVSRSLWLGLRVRATAGGLIVAGVQAGSPADKAGLKEGDLIRQVEEHPVRTLGEWNERLLAAPDRPRFSIQRRVEQRTLSVSMVPLADLIRQRLGATVQPLTAELAQALGLPRAGGLLVAEIDKGGPADQARLKKGHVIVGIDNQSAVDVLNGARALMEKRRGETARLRVQASTPRGLAEGLVNVEVR